MPESKTVNIIVQVITGVAFLHKKGILHRDIKLGNILFSGNRVKLADFGLSIRYRDQRVPREICGTPNFLAPEVYEIQLHSTASDVWAIGCVLYSLLVGQNPFLYKGMKETSCNIMNMNFKVPQFLSAEAKNAITLILDKNYQRTCSKFQEIRAYCSKNV